MLMASAAVALLVFLAYWRVHEPAAAAVGYVPVMRPRGHGSTAASGARPASVSRRSAVLPAASLLRVRSLTSRMLPGVITPPRFPRRFRKG